MVAAVGSARVASYTGSSGPRHSSQVAAAAGGWRAPHSVQASGNGRGPRWVVGSVGAGATGRSRALAIAWVPRPAVPQLSAPDPRKTKAPGAKKTLGTRGFLAFV